MTFKTALKFVFAMGVLLMSGTVVQAETITVTDISGREVAVNVPVQRAVLGEGRQLYIVAALDRENPAKRIVGWRKDLIEADPATYKAYLAKFPEFADIPVFDGLEQSLIDIEKTIAQKPDVVFLNIGIKKAVEEANYVEKLGALDIPVIYVDFRNDPEHNTEPSIRLFGKLFHQEDRAEDFIAFRSKEIAKVSDKLSQFSGVRPKVFVDRAGGFYEDCCHSFGAGNFGAMVEMAGGINVAKKLIPGTFGQINAEQVIVSSPDHIIVTSAQWDAYVPGGKWVPVGPGADMNLVKEKLQYYPTRPAYIGIAAQKTHAFHAVWHQFYNSPYQFVAIQQLAKWFHPNLFANLDPDATFRKLHDDFLPIDYRPGYFGSLQGIDE